MLGAANHYLVQRNVAWTLQRTQQALAEEQERRVAIERQMQNLTQQYEAARQQMNNLERQVNPVKFSDNNRLEFGQLNSNSRYKRKRRMSDYLDHSISNIPGIARARCELTMKGGHSFVSTHHFNEDGNGDMHEALHEIEEVARGYDQVKLAMLLNVKDRYKVSDSALHEIHMIYKSNIPPLNVIKRKRTEWNSIIPIHSIPGVSIADCV